MKYDLFLFLNPFSERNLMKLLLAIVFSLALVTLSGCEDAASPTPAPASPTAETHTENDGHDHNDKPINKPKDAHAEGEDHSDHGH